MDFTITFELGPIYEITYLDGRKIRFQVVGGPNVEVRILDEVDRNVSTLSSILHNFKSIVKIDERL